MKEMRQDNPVTLATVLTRYGLPLASYRGRGVIQSADGTVTECAFEAGQLSTGMIVLLCDFFDHLPHNTDLQQCSFSGSTEAGWHLVIAQGDLAPTGWLGHDMQVPPDR